MKKRFFVFMVILLLALSSPSCAVRIKAGEDPEPAISSYLETLTQQGWSIKDKQPLHAGGYLMLTSRRISSSFNCDLALITVRDGYIALVESPILSPSHHIFGNSPPSRFSKFGVYEGYQGTDFIVYVTAYFSTGDFDDYYTIPGRDITPFDSLGTTPLCFWDSSYHSGCPAWIFDLPVDMITDDYELNYGGYLLTGEELLSVLDHPSD